MVEQLGLVVAALLAEAQTQAASKAVGAGIDVIRTGIEKVRGWFSSRDDGAGVAALEALIAGQDLDINRMAVGARLERLAQDPAIRLELEQLVDDARAAGADLSAASQTANGDHNTMINSSPGASISITTEHPPPPNT